jgi:hypothetical protein
VSSHRAFQWGQEFRAYDPTASGAAGPGRLTLEQVLIPRDATARELPAVRFSFFEPETGTYRTIARGPFPIAVRAAPGTQTAVIGGQAPAARQAPEKEKLGRDIVYIKDSPGDLGARDRSFYLQPWFFAFQAAPVMLVGLMAAGLRRRRVLSADPRLARQQRAGRTARAPARGVVARRARQIVLRRAHRRGRGIPRRQARPRAGRRGSRERCRTAGSCRRGRRRTCERCSFLRNRRARALRARHEQ